MPRRRAGVTRAACAAAACAAAAVRGADAATGLEPAAASMVCDPTPVGQRAASMAGSRWRFSPAIATDSSAMRVSYEVQGLAFDARYAVHVHEFGAIGTGDASGVGDVYIGPCGGDCRLSGVKQAVGALGGAAATVWSGEAEQGSLIEAAFVEDVATAAGARSVLGRALVLHHPDGEAATQCVLGRADADEPASTAVTPADDMPPHVWSAACALRKDPREPPPELAGAHISPDLIGILRIDTSAQPVGGLRFEMHMRGQPHSSEEGEEFTYSLRVLAKGDLRATFDGANPLFTGTSVDCDRSALGRDCDRAVGLLDVNGALNVPLDLGVHAAFHDARAALWGPNSILGRTIVLERESTAASGSNRHVARLACLRVRARARTRARVRSVLRGA